MIDESVRQSLRAVADRVVPADEWPSASAAGVVDYLETHADRAHRRHWDSLLAAGLKALDADAQTRHGAHFADLDVAHQDALLADVEAGSVGSWPIDPRDFFATLVALIIEGYYTSRRAGARRPVSWAMIGFSDRQAGTTDHHVAEKDPPAKRLAAAREHYDVIVIGAGAGGGTAAARLATAGYSVLVIERGSWLRYDDIGADHLRNHRLSLYGHNTGPADNGHERTIARIDGTEHITKPFERSYHNNAMTFGGGTRVFGAQAWRFLPEDFAMATRYGVPDGSSLQDWPIGYDDLEPYYEQIEWDIGVAGRYDGHPAAGRRRRGYPMAPLPPNREARLLQAAARTLGWEAGPVPLLVNTVPRAGRGACERCGQCVGFACPADAKNGPYNTVLLDALVKADCHLVLDSMAERITTDVGGRVTGVSVVACRGPAADNCTERRIFTASHVVVACGAIESARLLLNSATDQEPAGLGNRSDQVGRHLQGHTYAGAFGLFDEPVQDSLGPGPGVATLRFCHANEGLIGGGMLANDFVKLPLSYWFAGLPAAAPRWGAEGKRAMRDGYPRTSHVQGPTQEIPNPEARVRVSPTVRDVSGVPVAMLSGSLHAETLRSAEFLNRQAAAWLTATGAQRIWVHQLASSLSGGQHQSGTLRMGNDPGRSVTDPTGRVHGHDNLWVADASLHVTNGSVNPVLTVMALAHRTADYLTRSG